MLMQTDASGATTPRTQDPTLDEGALVSAKSIYCSYKHTSTNEFLSPQHQYLWQQLKVLCPKMQSDNLDPQALPFGAVVNLRAFTGLTQTPIDVLHAVQSALVLVVSSWRTASSS